MWLQGARGRPLGQQRGHGLGVDGLPEVVTLHKVAVESPEEIELLLVLDTLGDDLELQPPTKLDHGAHHGGGLWGVGYRPNERVVNFQDVEGKLS